MKKIIFVCVLLLSVISVVFYSDTLYLRLNESKWNDVDYYFYELNVERERQGESTVELEVVDIYTSYSGNSLYISQVYVEGQFEMIFLTKALKKGMFDWEYHTLPFTTTENIIDEALERWSLE